jgi:hypothetical protein
MNRDELRERGEAGLTQQQQRGVQLLYPVDAQAGGSWIGANNGGLIAALLNRYQAPTISNARSRGAIIPELLQSRDAATAIERFKQLDPEPYNPFDCVLLSPELCYQFSWDREHFSWQQREIGSGLMWTSSSERLSAVTAYRQQQFAQCLQAGADAHAIGRLHLQQPAAMAGSAIFMSRPQTHSKSLVQISLTEKQLGLQYFDQHSLQANSELAALPVSAEQCLSLNRTGRELAESC